MSDSSSDRGARKAALGSTTSGEPIGSMDIAGVAQGIDVHTFSWGAQGGTNRHVNQVTIVKKIDAVSGNLLRAALQGQVLPSVTIELSIAGARPYATYALEGVHVQAVEHSAGDGDEHVVLEAADCLSFTPASGNPVGWDNTRGRSC